MTAKNAAGLSFWCMDDNASLAQALSPVNSDFQNAATPEAGLGGS